MPDNTREKGAETVLRDSDESFGWISIGLHWITAIAVIFLYFTGEELEELVRGPERSEVLLTHVSIGMIILIPVLYRMFWRMSSGSPERPPQNRVLELLATWIPILLLIAVFIAMISGVLVPWSVGNSLDVFDWFAIPSPLASSRPFHEFLEEVHDLSAHVILALFVLHILGTLKHVIFDRDNTLTRMLWVRGRD